MRLSGPTLQLHAAPGESADNSMTDFMYFIALISPEPVTLAQSPGNTQHARLVSSKRRTTSNGFVVTAEVEFSGQGYQRTIFDHTEKFRQSERQLKAGAILDHRLGSISVEGTGILTVEVEGTFAGSVLVITQVRLMFNSRGNQSPVTIDLYDVRQVDGSLRKFNQTLARVNSLTFRRQPGIPKMAISVASVRRADAADSTWESLKSKVKATAVSLVMDPVDVDPEGNEAMLRFGGALVSEAPAFTFPHARNLRP
jgi:hypothetical protein